MQEVRYKYSQSLYNREFEIKERLEKKAAAVFALPSTLLGALFLKAEPVKELSSFLNKASPKGYFVFLLLLFLCFLACLLLTISYSIASIMVQQYRKEYPKQLYTFLFKPGTRHLQTGDHFYEEIAGRLAIATEHNAKTNDIKSKRLSRAVLMLFLSVIFLLVFLSIFLLKGI
jgi:hypothetical protein